MKRLVALVMFVCLGFAVTANANVYQAGGDRLAAMQNADGGWGWELTGTSATNTVGPIAMGLAKAYRATGDAGQLAALQKAGSYLLSNTESFSPSAGYIAAELDSIFGVTTYSNHVKTNYYDKLAAGTYNRNGAGILYNTAGYINAIRTERAAAGYGNMATWDIGMGLYAAHAIGADTTEWVAGTKAKLNEMTSGYEFTGLAGALLGLASVNETFDPTSGNYASASSLQDLGDMLVGFQVSSTGGFVWWAGDGSEASPLYEAVMPGYEGMQYTAYALLALKELNSARYASQIALGGRFLEGTQMVTGGWQAYPDYGSENNEITGEALWAIPEPATMAMLALGGLILRRRMA